MPDDVTPAGGNPAPAAAPAIFGETPGAFAPGWTDHIPGMEPYKAMAVNYTDLPSVFKTLGDNMAVARGKAGIQPLPADATDEQKSAWDTEVRRLMGVPEQGTPEAYALKPETLPDGVTWDEGRAAKFAEIAHKVGMTPGQAKEMQSLYLGIQQEEVAARETAWKTGMEKEAAELKTTFGDKLNNVVTSAQRAALAVNLPADVMNPQSPNFMALSGVQILQMANKLAEALGETRLPAAGAVNALSPRDQAMDIINNPANPLHALYNKGDAAANATVDRLLAGKA